jgi:hypothetical protein
MYRLFKVFLSAAVLISVLTAVSPLRADVLDMYCYLEATTVEVFIVVWEEDRQGNKGRQVWQGIIKQGQQVRIPNRTGSIRYSSTVYIGKQDALSGDTSRWCSDAATIGVP